jgi:hypothetical protein
MVSAPKSVSSNCVCSGKKTRTIVEENHTHAYLKKLCRDEGIPVSGNKTVLAKRLNDHFVAQSRKAFLAKRALIRKEKEAAAAKAASDALREEEEAEARRKEKLKKLRRMGHKTAIYRFHRNEIDRVKALKDKERAMWGCIPHPLTPRRATQMQK